MKTPGFSAETSIYQADNHYRSAAHGSFLSNGNATITPQGCGVLNSLFCAGFIGICTPLCIASCAIDTASCAACFALCLGGTYLTCKDCIPGTGGGGGGGGGNNPPLCCPRGQSCRCGGTCVPGMGCVDGECLSPGQSCQ